MSRGHFVQFYKADEPMLNRNVGQFLWEGLLRGDGLLVIATPARRESLADHLTRLGADVRVARRERQLLMLDAGETLDRLMLNGMPDWYRFQATMEEALASVRLAAPGAPIRAYGEMVGVLWDRGQREAAIRLEELWNRLLQSRPVTLFCGYPIDVFDEDFGTGHVHEILHAHTQVMPTGPNGDMAEALRRAMCDVLGAEEGESPGVNGEEAILALRKEWPRHVNDILARARRYFAAGRAAGTAESSAA